MNMFHCDGGERWRNPNTKMVEVGPESERERVKIERGARE